MKFSPDNSLKPHSRLVGVEGGEFVGGLNGGAASECRVADVFGHTYGWLFEALEREIGRARTPTAPLRRLSQKLGHDGFVYTNELEDGESAADSYCVFDAQKISVLGEDMVQCGGDRVKCSA